MLNENTTVPIIPFPSPPGTAAVPDVVCWRCGEKYPHLLVHHCSTAVVNFPVLMELTEERR